MKIKESESEVTQSCPTPSDPMDYSPPGPPSMGFPGKSTRVGCHCLLWKIKEVVLKNKTYKLEKFGTITLNH